MTQEKIGMLEGERFGYRFIYTMARKIDAGIHIASKPGEGTSVTITIPHKTEGSESSDDRPQTVEEDIN